MCAPRRGGRGPEDPGAAIALPAVARPRRYQAGGDAVLAVLDTNPVSVIADIREVGVDGSAMRALGGVLDSELPWREPPELLELATLRDLTGFSLPDAGDPATVLGRTVLTAAIGQRQRRRRVWSIGTDTSLAAAQFCWIPWEVARVAAASWTWPNLTRATASTFEPSISLPQAPGSVADDPPEEPQRLSRQGYGPDDIRIGCGGRGVFPMDWSAVLCDTCRGGMHHGGF